MVRRFGGLMLLGLVVALVVAACGGDDPTPTPVVIEKEVIREVVVEVEVTATPTAAATPTPTTDPSTVEQEFRLMASAFYASFVEGWRVALDNNTGGRITMVPEEATGDDAVNFLRSRPEEAGRTMYTLHRRAGPDVAGGRQQLQR